MCHLNVVSILDSDNVLFQRWFWVYFYLDRSMVFILLRVLI